MAKISAKDQFNQARAFEQAGDYKEAEKNYLALIKRHTTFYDGYKRLMIIYRKQTEYQKELAMIHKAIKAFQEHALHDHQQLLADNPKAKRISKKLAKDLGLLDSRGRPTTEDPILDEWRRREAIVKKKLKK